MSNRSANLLLEVAQAVENHDRRGPHHKLCGAEEEIEAMNILTEIDKKVSAFIVKYKRVPNTLLLGHADAWHFQTALIDIWKAIDYNSAKGKYKKMTLLAVESDNYLAVGLVES